MNDVGPVAAISTSDLYPIYDNDSLELEPGDDKSVEVTLDDPPFPFFGNSYSDFFVS